MTNIESRTALASPKRPDETMEGYVIRVIREEERERCADEIERLREQCVSQIEIIARLRAALALHHALAEADRREGDDAMWTRVYAEACEATAKALGHSDDR